MASSEFATVKKNNRVRSNTIAGSYLSMASDWEIGIKSGMRKIGLLVPYTTFLDTGIAVQLFTFAANRESHRQ